MESLYIDAAIDPAGGSCPMPAFATRVPAFTKSTNALIALRVSSGVNGDRCMRAGYRGVLQHQVVSVTCAVITVCGGASQLGNVR
jgi:hypothetical protein